MPGTTLAAANVQIVHDKAVNLRRFLELIDEAGAAGVDILVLPEMGLQGYADFAFGLGDKGVAEQKQYYYREAETIPGPATAVIQERIARYGMTVQVGIAEKALHGNVIFNSTALITPQGVAGVFRKLHNQFEFPYFNPGEATPVFDIPAARVASMICYDLAFPELMRVFALKGATVTLMSTAWPMKGHDRSDDYHGWAMDLSAQANAFFNQMWLVISNHCETGVYSGGLDYWGHSQIVDPYGKVVAILESEEGLVVHTADLSSDVLQSRTNGFFGLNLLQDRRPQHYGLLADADPYLHGQAPIIAGVQSPPDGPVPPAPVQNGATSDHDSLVAG
jgi:predicted amidohydrolase